MIDKLDVTENEPDVGLVDMWKVIWAFRRLILSMAVVAVLISTYIALSAKIVYRAEVSIVQADSTGVSELSSLSGAVGSLIGFKGRSNSSINRILAILKSKAFINSFVEKEGITRILFQSRWNDDLGKWKAVEVSFLRKGRDAIIKFFNESYISKVSSAPTEWQVYKAFNELLSVSQNLDSGVTKIYISWKDPLIAAIWANSIVNRLNAHMKHQDVIDAERSIEYLRAQIASSEIMEMQNILFQLIEEQTKVITLAETREEYMLKIIDPAIAPDNAISPNRKVMIVLGLFLGLFLGTVVAFILSFVDGYRQNTSNR